MTQKNFVSSLFHFQPPLLWHKSNDHIMWHTNRVTMFLSVILNRKWKIDFTHQKRADTVNLCNRFLWAAAAGARVIISLGCRNMWPRPHDDCDDEETSSSHMTAQLERFNLKQCAIAQQHFCCSVWQTGDSYSRHCLQFSVSRQEQRNHQGLCPWVELLALAVPTTLEADTFHLCIFSC